MAPGDNAGAGVVIVGFLYHVGDLLAGLGGDLVDEGIGQDAAELLRHFGGPGGHGVQHLGAVQELTADNEPELHVFQCNVLLNMIKISDFYCKCSTAARSAGIARTYRSMKALKPAASSGSGWMVVTGWPANTRLSR